MHGAGGTQGGIEKFFVGLAMMIGGGYLLLDAIRVTTIYHWRLALYSWNGVNVTTGGVLIVFVFGVGILFYNAKQIFGWILTAGSLLALIFGVLRRLQFHLEPMSLFDLTLILVLLFGGIGLFLNSLSDQQKLSSSRETS